MKKRPIKRKQQRWTVILTSVFVSQKATGLNVFIGIRRNFSKIAGNSVDTAADLLGAIDMPLS